MTTRTYLGRCHCGAVRYEVDVDLSEGTGRCNCTFCTKSGWWGVNVKPNAFRLLSGADNLTEYSRHEHVRKPFCKTCGMRAFGWGNIPAIGGEHYFVNLNCLEDVDLDGVKVTHLNGRNNTWAPVTETTHADPYATAAA